MRLPLGSAKRPKTLLREPSPYGSGQLIVEADAEVSAAYLLGLQGEVRSSLWLANHVPAPPDLDRERITAGLLPPMPARNTVHKDGRAPLRTRTLEVVWFPEGDGVAILERGAPLAVIPADADPGRGEPGYCSHATRRTPLAWPLHEKLSVFGPRIDEAKSFWRWRASRTGWNEYQNRVLEHLGQRLGKPGRYWAVDDDRLPGIGVVEHDRNATRPFAVTSTVGMSCQRMPAVHHQPRPPFRIELAIATTRPYEAAATLFSWLGPRPWRRRTWFGDGHVALWNTDEERRPRPFPLGRRWRGAIMVTDPVRLRGPLAPDLSGLVVGGDTVRWLWLVPVGEDSATTADGGALLEHLTLTGHRWVTDV